MSYIEAIQDDIRFVDSSIRTSPTLYYPHCHICGAEVMSYNYIRGKNYTCKACKLEKHLSDREDKAINDFTAKEKKFLKACERIQRVVDNPRIYNEAANAVYEQLHNNGWFDSTEEIMVAIELCRRKIEAKHQVKFGRYRADFVLPAEKIVLEVDGVVYHTKDMRDRESIRDNLIVLSLGAEWEVIRVTDEMINQNLSKLMPAIRKARDARQKARKRNKGMLPNWYTDRRI